MRKQIFTFGAMIMLAILFGACSPAASGPIQLGPDDNGSDITLSAGQLFNITLPGNPTTGYAWETSPTPDAAILELVEEPTFTSDSKALGSGGEFIFTYRAVGAGQTDLRLIYHRSFEQDTPPLEEYTLTVRVTE